MRLCAKCGKEIPEGRLEALPDTATCVECSEVEPRTTADVTVDGCDEQDLIRSLQQPEK